MSFPDFDGDASPRRPLRVRPSITTAGRRLLGVPWQPFELEFLDHMVPTEQAFRRFCMFGRMAPSPMPNCARPVRIGGHLYDAEALQNAYIAQAIGGAVQQLLADAQKPGRGGTAGAKPAPSMEQSVAEMRRLMLRPLVRDALLIEICARRAVPVDLRDVGANLAQLAFEVFLGDAAPHELPRRLVHELSKEGLVRRLPFGDSHIGSEIAVPCETARSLVRGMLLPRWQCARVRPSRARGH